jgi:hypothetical protein
VCLQEDGMITKEEGRTGTTKALKPAHYQLQVLILIQIVRSEASQTVTVAREKSVTKNDLSDTKEGPTAKCPKASTSRAPE